MHQESQSPADEQVQSLGVRRAEKEQGDGRSSGAEIVFNRAPPESGPDDSSLRFEWEEEPRELVDISFINSSQNS